MSILKNFITDNQYTGVTFGQEDINALVDIEVEIASIRSVLDSDKENFKTSLESLPQDLLITMKLPEGVSIESVNDDMLREILKSSMESKQSILDTLMEKFNATMKDMKHIFMSHQSILDEVEKYDFKDLDISTITAKYIDKNLVSFVACGNTDTESVLNAMMKDKNSELINSHINVLNFLYSSKYEKMTIDEAVVELPKEMNKIKAYEGNLKALLKSKSLHRTPKHVKLYANAMLSGKLTACIINPYPRTATIISAGEHNVNSLYNSVNGKKTLVMSSMLRIEDDSIKCDAGKVSEKTFKAFLKYSRDEIKELFKTVSYAQEIGKKSIIADGFTTKSSVVYDYRKAILNAGVHIGKYTETHCDLLKALIRDAKIEGK